MEKILGLAMWSFFQETTCEPFKWHENINGEINYE